MNRNLIKCGRCGGRHNVGSKRFMQCERYTLNKFNRNRGELKSK